MRISASGLILVVAAATGCAPKAREARGVTMGTFVPDAAIQAVEVCKTTEAELLASFGRPSGQGRDGDFTTLQWSGASVIADNTQGMTTMQIIYVWIADGRVAGMTVNPVGFPSTPAPCPAAADASGS